MIQKNTKLKGGKFEYKYKPYINMNINQRRNRAISDSPKNKVVSIINFKR